MLESRHERKSVKREENPDGKGGANARKCERRKRGLDFESKGENRYLQNNNNKKNKKRFPGEFLQYHIL